VEAQKNASTSASGIVRSDTTVLYFSMFVMGGCGLAYEYTLSKMASDLLGNSARQWAVIIGVMMFFMGVGADLQKYFSNQRLIEKLILAELLVGLVGGFGPIALLYVYGAWPDGYLLLQYALISGIGLLIGFEIPLLTRINERSGQELSANLGGILKMDYTGALCGALAWVYVLPLFFSITETAFVLGLLNLSAALIALLYFRHRVTAHWWYGGALVAGMLSLTIGLVAADEWTSFAEQKLYRDRILFSQTTPFQHIVLTRSSAGDHALYINGHLQFHSFDEHIYHEHLVHPALNVASRRQNVLILGGGDGLALREVLRYSDVERVTLVDIDPAITELASSHPVLTAMNANSLSSERVQIIPSEAVSTGDPILLQLPNHRARHASQEAGPTVRVMNIDAVRFLEQVPGLFDVILIDFPDPNAPELSKLYSLQFYELLRSKLAIDGVFAQQSTSPVHANEAFLCIGRTLRAAGLAAVPYHDSIPSFGEWGWWIGGRDDRHSESQLREAMQNLKPFSVPTRYLTPELVGASLIFGRGQLDTLETSINTLTRDAVYRYYLEAWKRP
jgi:spermidine synthase